MKIVVCVSESEEGPVFQCILQIPDGIGIVEETKEWNRWYEKEYCAERFDNILQKKVKYHSLLHQLKSKGCVEIEMEVWEV